MSLWTNKRLTMNKIVKPRLVAAALREVLYSLALRKSSLEDKYTMLKLYDARIDIKGPNDEWNVVDLTQCNPGVIHASKIKAEAWLRKLA
jgi:hypothetical protein